ncbi:MAG TPA: VCBS repeat-containing protein [Thermoanaerobaculia bacterium]|nr:VCBS repeat-containing protein [Thermoanaerobaculia bacterium]
MSDYLWDRTGEPDADVVRLEQLLARYRYDRPMRKQMRIARGRWLRNVAAAAAALLIIAGVALAAVALRLHWTKGRPWDVIAVAGAVTINGKAVAARDLLRPGDELRTGGNSRVTIRVARIGAIEVGPSSIARLVTTESRRHRLALQRGTVRARIWAPPFTFGIETAAGLASDLGCDFTLQFAGGRGSIHVTSGWVDFDGPAWSSVIPENATAELLPHGPGTPVYADAPYALRDAVRAYDAGGSLSAVLRHARPRDSMTLMHILERAKPEERALAVDAAAALAPLPRDVTREQLIAGDLRAFDRWRESAGLRGTKQWLLRWRDAFPAPQAAAQPRRRAIAHPSPPRTESYAVGAGPRAVAVGDFDTDGQLDVAVASSGAGTVSTLFGSGRRLRAGATIPAGREPTDIKAADVDNDDDLDLVIANHETSAVTVLLNDGKGSFIAAPYSPLAMGARPHIHSVTAADFDGDGWIDLAVESSDTRDVRLRRGSANGFHASIAIDVRTMPYNQLGAADVSGDGVADLLVPGHNDRTARGVTRRANGFGLAPWTIATGNTPWLVNGADVDGDRRADVLVVETDAVSVWLQGANGFSHASWSPVRVAGATGLATGDLDGDGIADIAIGPWSGSGVTVWASRGRRTHAVTTCQRPIGLAIADLNRDGSGDLIVACNQEDRLLVVPFPLR